MKVDLGAQIFSKEQLIEEYEALNKGTYVTIPIEYTYHVYWSEGTKGTLIDLGLFSYEPGEKEQKAILKKFNQNIKSFMKKIDDYKEYHHLDKDLSIEEVLYGENNVV